MKVRADFFDTVEILIAQLCLRRAPSVFFVEPFAYVADEFFARFKFFHVVVADDQLDCPVSTSARTLST